MVRYEYRGKVALVTGASRGIGEAIAIALAREGAEVALVARSEEGLQRVQGRITAEGGTAATFVADVAREDDLQRAIQGAAERWGRLDILVNCAGIGVFRPLAETSTTDWDRVMAVNVRGAFIACREAIPFLTQPGGVIVNISSVVGIKGYVNQGAYTASKHALMGMTKVLAQELQPSGVRVHIVCPGGVDTALVGDARPDLDRSVLIRPEEVADVVLFLVAQPGHGIVDQINLRRSNSAPWFSE